MSRAARPGAGVIALLLTLGLCALPPASEAARFKLVNVDDPGEGLNDTSPVTPVTGNPGRTVGAQRKNVLEAVFWHLGRLISSSEEIVVEVAFDSLNCGPLSGTLASAGPRRVVRDFDGAHRRGVWYASALAEAIAGESLVEGRTAIGVTVNKDVGTTGCLATREWDHRIGTHSTNGFLLFKVLLHEVVHGMNFTTFIDSNTGELFLGFADVYSLFVEDHATGRTFDRMSNNERVEASTGDLDWVGPNAALHAIRLLDGRRSGSEHPRLYSPDEFDAGSSVAHWDTSLNLNVDEYMEPFARPSSTDFMTQALLQDIGWPINRGGIAWLDDINGNGSIEIAVLAVSDSPPGHKVVILDSFNRQLLNTIMLPSNRSAVGLATVPHFDGGPGGEIAVLTWRLQGNQVQAYLFDSTTGDQLRTLTFPSAFPMGFKAVPDYGGTAAGELAVLATRPGTGIRVWVRDAQSGAYLRTLAFPDHQRPIDFAFVDNSGGGPAPEIAVAMRSLLLDNAFIRTRDGRSGALIGEIALPETEAHQFIGAMSNFGGGPAGEVAVLSLVGDEGTPEIKVYDSGTGELLTVGQLPGEFMPVGLEVLPNFGGTPADELVVWNRRPDDLRPRAEILDGGSLSYFFAPSLAIKNTPVAIARLPNIGGTGAADMAVLTHSESDRAMRIFLYDGRGRQIRNMLVP